VRAADVAVINHIRRWPTWAVAILYAVFGMGLPLMAAILPEDRADILYHRYEGDGVTVDGPSILARKSVGKHTSLYANYYTDSVTSASIDVRTTASQYTEKREQYSFGGDLLVDNTTMTLGYTNSEENDYTSNTYNFGISHDMFGDLTTVSLGFIFGDDKVRKNEYDENGNFVGNNEDFGEKDMHRRRYNMSLTQIMTKNLIMNFGFETISDEGYTKNPYRSARIYGLDSGGAGDPPILFTPEVYPKTRTSDAFAIRANYFLPYRAAIHAEFKYYDDTWNLKANSFKLTYVQPLKDQWTIDITYRYYTQEAASIYKDIYEFNEDNLLYYARDKELSQFTSHTLGAAVTYEFLQSGWWQFDKGSVSFRYELMDFQYDNFTDLDPGPDESPNPNYLQPFSFDAEVFQLYFSIWY
jgi:hypothetical protein